MLLPRVIRVFTNVGIPLFCTLYDTLDCLLNSRDLLKRGFIILSRGMVAKPSSELIKRCRGSVCVPVRLIRRIRGEKECVTPNKPIRRTEPLCVVCIDSPPN